MRYRYLVERLALSVGKRDGKLAVGAFDSLYGLPETQGDALFAQALLESGGDFRQRVEIEHMRVHADERALLPAIQRGLERLQGNHRGTADEEAFAGGRLEHGFQALGIFH